MSSDNTCCGYPVHEAAALFPLLPAHELNELSDDIKKHGLLHPVVMLKGSVLDGRNRLMACKQAHVKPTFEEFDGHGSPTEYALSVNLKRRDLTAGQKAAIAGKAEPLFTAEAKARQGHRSDITERIPECGEAREKAAAIVGVNPHYVTDVKRIKTEAPELYEQIAAGKITVPAAKAKLKPKPKRKERGTYDEWRKFKTLCGGISDSLSELAKLRVDGDHIIQARDLAEKLSSKLHSITKKIGA